MNARLTYYWLPLLISLVGCCFVNEAFAKKALGLEQVLHSVDQHFPKVIAARQELGKANAALASARSHFDPRLASKIHYIPDGDFESRNAGVSLNFPLTTRGVELYTGYRIGNGDYPDYYGEKKTQSNGEMRAGIRWPWLRDSAIDRQRADLTNAKLGLALNSAAFQSFKLNVYLEAALIYWDWVAAGFRLKFKNDLLNIAKSRQGILQKRFEHGDVAYVDVIENENLILQRKQQMLDAKLQFEQAAKRLALYYRDQDADYLSQPAHLPPSLATIVQGKRKQPLAFQGQHALSSTNNPQLIAFKNKLAQTSTNIQLAHNQLLPQLDSEVSVIKDLGHGSVDDRHSLNVLLNFSYPLYQRKAKAELRTQKLSYKQLSKENQFLQEQLATRFVNLQTQLVNKEQQIDLTRRAVKISHELEATEIEKYFRGASNLFLVNQRELFSNQAELNAIKVMIEYLKTRIELRVIDGKGFEPSV